MIIYLSIFIYEISTLKLYFSRTNTSPQKQLQLLWLPSHLITANNINGSLFEGLCQFNWYNHDEKEEPGHVTSTYRTQ